MYGIRKEIFIMNNELKPILARVDHTLLSQTATWDQIRAICDDGVKYGCASVCIPASYVKQAAEYVAGKIAVCTVIGFPNGYDTTASKCFQATDAEKVEMCRVVSESGADYIKTSTGFGGGGATREDVALFKANVAPHVKIKAAGGIANLDDARDFVALGADRLGTSRIVKAVKAMEQE